MNVLLTRNGYILMDNQSEYLLTDDVFLSFMKDSELRNEFLNTIGKSAIVVGRLGKQINKSIFKNKELNVSEASIGSFDKEVGYIAKL